MQGKRKKRKRDNKPDSTPEGKGSFSLSVLLLDLSSLFRAERTPSIGLCETVLLATLGLPLTPN